MCWANTPKGVADARTDFPLYPHPFSAIGLAVLFCSRARTPRLCGLWPTLPLKHRFDDRLADDNAFIIRDAHQRPVGDIGLRIYSANNEEADVGYSVPPAAQGQGVASQALQALCDYAFHQRGIQALNAWVLAENQGSVRVLEKRGFRKTQVLEKAYLLRGEYYDDWIFRLEKQDF